MKKTDLDSLIVQARQVTPPEPNWDRVKAKLFERIDAASPGSTEQELATRGTSSRAWVAAAVGLSLAAGVALLLGPWSGGRASGERDEGPRAGAAVRELPTGTFLGTVGRDGTSPVAGAVVTVGGHAIEVGKELGRGDVVEVKGASAIFERVHQVRGGGEALSSSPAAKVTFGVDEDSKIAMDGPIVVTLESGAIEADVAPVKNGEAFAVDIPVRSPSGVVTRARVAVHGTHLRVMRAGSLVTVDLTEGVVSIGRPPRSGSTYGTLVTAPAHVEFDAARLDTITVSHDAKDVRKAATLKVATTEGRSPSVAWKVDPEPTDPPPTPQSPKEIPGHPTTPTAPTPTTVQEDAKPVVDPRTSIVQAVKTCALARMHAANVKITVSTTLSMTVGPDGKVRTATFAPPLDPDTQECAARTIYASDFGADATETRLVSLVVEASSR